MQEYFHPTFVITKEKWIISTDSHADSYYVYNSAGELLNTIFEERIAAKKQITIEKDNA